MSSELVSPGREETREQALPSSPTAQLATVDVTAQAVGAHQVPARGQPAAARASHGDSAGDLETAVAEIAEDVADAWQQALP
jgi:hypothetical protein